jgi:hypothetical protein
LYRFGAAINTKIDPWSLGSFPTQRIPSVAGRFFSRDFIRECLRIEGFNPLRRGTLRFGPGHPPLACKLPAQTLAW